MGFSTFPNNPFPPSSAQFDEGKNEFIQAEIDAIKDGANIDSFGDVETALALKANTDDVNTALATKTNLSNIAPSFDATSGVYAVGDKVIYNGVLYEFTSAHSTAGEWDESEVQPVKISELIDSLKSGLTPQVITGITLPTGVGDGYISAFRMGKLIVISGYLLGNVNQAGAILENCPPIQSASTSSRFPAVGDNATEAFSVYFSVDRTTLYTNSAISNNVDFTIIYFTD